MGMAVCEPEAQRPLELEIGSKSSHEQLEIDYSGLALIFLAPGLGGFIYGYDVGATSFVLSMIRQPRDNDVWWYGCPKIQQGLLISSLALGALIGSHIVLVYLAERIGRRKEIRIAATLFIIGALLNITSGTLLAYTPVYQHHIGIGLIVLLCGRILTGVAVGFIMHGAPTYMAEMSPTSVRGTMVSAKETIIVFGVIIGMMNGDLMSDYSDNWADLYYISILAAIPMLVLTFKIPRSKRWLLMKGYREEARQSMAFVYKGDFEDEFERLAETMNCLCCRQTPTSTTDHSSEASITFDDNTSIQKSFTQESDVMADSIFSAKYRHIMFLGVGLLVLQQLSGQPTVLAYSRVLFQAAGWGGDTSVFTVVIMGITSTITASNVDFLGRKVFLKASSIIMTIAVAMLAYGFWNCNEDDENIVISQARKYIVLLGMFIYFAAFQGGFGTITWTVLSEIYPTEIRGKAMALSVEICFFCKFLSQLFFPVLQDLLGWGSTFILFTFTCALGYIFVHTKLIETKGMSLEEIQERLGKNNIVSPPEIINRPLESPLLDEESKELPIRLNPIT